MAISQSRLAIQALQAGISELIKKQSKERENLARFEAKASEFRRKISLSNRNSPLSTIQNLERQHVASLKDIARVSGIISTLEEKIVQKNKDLNRHKAFLERELEQESKKYLAEEKKLAKLRDERHKEDIKKLKEIQTLIDNQNRLRSDANFTRSLSHYQEYSIVPVVSPPTVLAEIEVLKKKMDLVIQTLEKLGFGQEIIFNELDEMKSITALTPKNWLQTFKGKMMDLALEKAIDIAVIPQILDLFSEESK